jgi:hypothetical protein
LISPVILDADLLHSQHSFEHETLLLLQTIEFMVVGFGVLAAKPCDCRTFSLSGVPLMSEWLVLTF